MKLFDAHCDTAFELWYRQEKLEHNACHIDLQKASVFERYAQVFAFCSYAGTPLAKLPLLSQLLSLLREEVDKHADRIAFAKNGEDIHRLNDMGKIAALLSLEGPELIDCDPQRLAECDFCMTTLTWNADNALAGCHLSDGGLTDRGRAFVAAAQQLGIYIDVSHLSDRAFFDLAEMTQKPILASHSNCRSLCPHSRNLTDDQLSVIAQSGGVVGLNLYVPFLGENADFETMRRHLEHMLQICSENHVCIGGDLDGCDVLPSGFCDVGNYLDFYNYLLKCGYSEALLGKIFYTNLLRLL